MGRLTPLCFLSVKVFGLFRLKIDAYGIKLGGITDSDSSRKVNLKAASAGRPQFVLARLPCR